MHTAESNQPQVIAFALPSLALAANQPPGQAPLIAKDNPTYAIADFSDTATKGVGFKFSKADGAFVDFRLSSAPLSVPFSLGEITLFTLADGAVKYTTTENKVKEEVILNKRPLTDELAFSWLSSGLDAVKREDGGYLLQSGGVPVFEISAPTVLDANGKSGRVSLDLAGDRATLKVDPEFLDNAAYPVTVDPSVVASSNGGAGYTSQRNAFYDPYYGKYWVLYTNDTHLKAKHSADGTDWQPATNPDITDIASGGYPATWARTDRIIYVVYRDGYSIYARKGTLAANSITWNARYQVFSGTSSNYWAYPAISQATGGALWVSATYFDGTNFKVKAKRSTNPNNVTAWDASSETDISMNSTSSQLIPQVLQLPGGDMYIVWLHGTEIRGKYYRYSSSSWINGMVIGYTYAADHNHIPSAVANGANITFGYADPNRIPKYRESSATASYATWTGPYQLAPGDTGNDIALTLDTVGGIYAFYGASPGSSEQIRQVKVGDSSTKLNINSPGNQDQVVAPYKTADKTFVTWRVNSANTIYSSGKRVRPSTSRSVNPPSPDPVTGWYKSPTAPLITLAKSPTDTWAGVTTWYRWGSTGDFSPYTGALTAPQGDKTLYYYSKDNVNNQETPPDVTYWTYRVKVDTNAPSTSASTTGTQGQSGWYTADVTVALAATDPGGGAASGVSSIKYRINGGSWLIYAGPLSITNEGINAIDYYATDVAGNTETAKQLLVKIDKTAPSAPILEPTPTGPDGDNGWYVSPVLVDLMPGEPEGILYAWDTTVSFSPYLDTLVTNEGTHTLYYYGQDDAGLTSPVQSETFKVDVGNPGNPTITSPSHTVDATSTDNTIDITLSGATDTVSGLDGHSVEWSQSAGTTPDTTVDLGVGATSTVSPPLAGGAWYFHLRTKDIAGNWSSAVHLGPFNMAAEPGLEG